MLPPTPVARVGPACQVKPERVLSEAAGTRDHQGVVAWAGPFRYADAYELAREDTPLLVCLDQVTDPHTWAPSPAAPRGQARPA